MSTPCLCKQACLNNAFLKLLLCVRLHFIKNFCKCLSLADRAGDVQDILLLPSRDMVTQSVYFMA